MPGSWAGDKFHDAGSSSARCALLAGIKGAGHRVPSRMSAGMLCALGRAGTLHRAMDTTSPGAPRPAPL